MSAASDRIPAAGSEIQPEEILLIEKAISSLTVHPRYHRRIGETLAAGQNIILNYHHHSGESRYCVSVMTQNRNLAGLVDGTSIQWEELAHIKEVGRDESRVFPIMTNFGRLFKIQYGMNRLPDVYLNGKPYLTDDD